MISYYTVFRDTYDGIPDDDSFETKAQAEAKYHALKGKVPFRKLEVYDDLGDITLARDLQAGFYD